ncbi:SDR family NAD(P)-dependent oxidoreductase [Klenkia taihuensis]|uniref:Short-chain dehydrogenase n=1 Tax=Klenkia taihuensis TaxID=1225127 RepID=A0A1I1HU54_9ACTN|nr:SDR family NAD(P)-dependent oxidoreductase [Klenkia taihuensis]GHE09002.1 short-chain dehydrogenase [Klenkia taihuensis]SFC27679.1 Short-chain dehydrogenase [Klenkia taihuensis]
MTSPRTALITGASSGIGRATALLLAAEGASLVLLARGRPALEATAQECRAAGAADVVVEPCDVNDREAVADVVRRAGALDLVVHSATVMAYGDVEDLPADVFDHVVDTAIKGTANLARPVLATFRRQQRGDLVIVSSLLASVTAPTMGAYCTAKWGQLGLIRTLQQETRDVPGIRVGAVAPGGVNTPIYYQAATVLGNTGHPPPPVYSPRRVARAVLDVAGSHRRLRQSGFANPLVIAGFRLAPPVYDALVGPLLKVFGMARDSVPATEGNVFASVPGRNAEKGPWHDL